MGMRDAVAGVAKGSDGFALRIGVPAALIGLAGVGWWWSARVAADMSGDGVAPLPMDSMSDMGDMGSMAGPMSFAAFVVAWVAMMAAMMLPAILPVVMLYARAAGRGTVAPLPFFVGGYLALWTTLAGPAHFAGAGPGEAVGRREGR